jgi:hypothetical protein
MFRRGGGFPMADSPLELLVMFLVLAVLIWLVYRLVNS